MLPNLFVFYKTILQNLTAVFANPNTIFDKPNPDDNGEHRLYKVLSGFMCKPENSWTSNIRSFPVLQDPAYSLISY